MDAPRAAGHALNVATGQQLRVVDLACALARELDSTLEPEITGEFRAGDIRHCFADMRRAEELIGFRAQRTLADGLPELAEWVARQVVDESGDEALADLRRLGLVG